MERLDLVLIMSVNPGFGGQTFIASSIPKIAEARKRINASGRDIWLEVDGGIKADNIARAAEAGRRHIRGGFRGVRREGPGRCDRQAA